MYIVTFYSYKGGVGRTMALANVATLLAQKGKRVLVVDFDLEAPTLPNYGYFSTLEVERGIVDYVTEYRDTGIAPNSERFIYRCDHNGNTIWLMPAGDTSTIDYSRKLASIDWKLLYDEEKGFLLFEDLKQQWQMFEQEGFDYVLVDSRTGHTDVGGICTRQLPDLVVAMFLPTMQNILGMAPIIDEVRNEKSRLERPVELVFCAANVPDLDDEQQILSDLLQNASIQLGYERDTLNIVHHYGSLYVLSHAIFAQDRPNSRLSREYGSLFQTIVAHNFEDAFGAKLALQRILQDVRSAPRKKAKKSRDDVAQDVDRIFSLHYRHDAEVAFLVSRVRSEIGDLEGEIAALSAAIDLGDGDTSLRGFRARAYQRINMTDRSVADLRYILKHESVSGAEVTAALRMLERTDKGYDEAFDQLLERRDLDASILNSIAEVAQRNRRHLRKFADQVKGALASSGASEAELENSQHHLGLALIGCGRFKEAVAQFENRTQYSHDSLHFRFNRFIAMWGASGEPDLGFADELRELMSEAKGRNDANFSQCRAVIHAVLSDHQEALEALYLSDEIAESHRGRIFSCSSYLYLDFKEFVEDNKALRKAISEDGQVSIRIFREAVDDRIV